VRYEQNSRALKMVLEDSTLEEATWALSQTMNVQQRRPHGDAVDLVLLSSCTDYKALLQQLQNSKTSSGDSFYIRVNISLPADTSGALAVSCNDILHVTNTRPDDTEDLWHASQVHPCQLLDLQSGTVPNYYRPILLLPTILGRMLDKKLDSWQGFQLCEPGKKCYNLLLDKICEGLHCVLPLGLDCVRRLHRFEIFPIIIFIGLSARNARKLRSKLQRNGQTEEQLLACSKSEEPLLDKLPCLYHSVDPDSWCDQNSLLTSLRTRIWEEQRKIVWVEPDLW
ncbi:hypothetical protein XENOCAPTIV_001197, partial [Xenoophorus captivus]